MKLIKTLDDLAPYVDYSFINALTPDPKASSDGVDHNPRQVYNGHYVPVNPTPIQNPYYIAHSQTFFKELGFDESLARSEEFMLMFTGDLSNAPEPMKQIGWATGYALSIYGTEYYSQCPFQTGNGYGDGRAVSIFEGVLNGKRYEMQLKGGGRTPYCRGADGRAVLRSSIREFLAQEHMHALRIPTSRSLSLFASHTETVRRPWFNDNSYSRDPEVMIEESVAITTRVASSFLRVGQIELFGRRARKHKHTKALEELEQIVLHVCDREYGDVIDKNLPLEEKILLLALHFRDRLTSLVANWVRVGFCQGNFNSDNTALGGFTLDYGPFGFIDMFDPRYQPWTGGGAHFSFFNQPLAAEQNFMMFCTALMPLLQSNPDASSQLNAILEGFSAMMQEKWKAMWTSKLGLATFDAPLFNDLIPLMIESSLDYTIFFRELSHIPEDFSSLLKSFYNETIVDKKLLEEWKVWHQRWLDLIDTSRDDISVQMKKINPKYTLREWFLVDAYRQAENGDYTLIHELQEVMNDPYSEQSSEIEAKYYRKKPLEYFRKAGISHISCSS